MVRVLTGAVTARGSGAHAHDGVRKAGWPAVYEVQWPRWSCWFVALVCGCGRAFGMSSTFRARSIHLCPPANVRNDTRNETNIFTCMFDGIKLGTMAFDTTYKRHPPSSGSR